MGTVLNWGNPLQKPYPLFLLGFVITIVYIPGILGAAITTGWLFLFIICPFLLLYCDKLNLGWGFVFICYAAISLIWSNSLNISLFYLLKLIILGCVFWIAQNITDIKPIFKGLAVGLGVASILAWSQYFGYHQVYSLGGRPAAFFINTNIYSELSAVILIGLIILNLWRWIPVTFTGLFLVHSRAAFVGLGVGLFMWGWKINKIISIASLIFIILIGAIVYRDNFSFTSIQERLSIWQDTIQGFKLFGNGIGSYEIMFPYYATHINTELARPKYAHNDVLNLIFEFGIGFTFLGMVILNVIKSTRKEIIILYTIFTISLFTYPLSSPIQAFIACMVAGWITSSNASIRGYGNYKRSILFKRNKRTEYKLS